MDRLRDDPRFPTRLARLNDAAKAGPAQSPASKASHDVQELSHQLRRRRVFEFQSFYVSLPSANHLMLEEEPAWPLFLEAAGSSLIW